MPGTASKRPLGIPFRWGCTVRKYFIEKLAELFTSLEFFQRLKTGSHYQKIYLLLFWQWSVLVFWLHLKSGISLWSKEIWKKTKKKQTITSTTTWKPITLGIITYQQKLPPFTSYEVKSKRSNFVDNDPKGCKFLCCRVVSFWFLFFFSFI